MVEGSGPEQMSPELENKAFSAKSTQYMAWQTRYVAVTELTDRQTDTHTERLQKPSRMRRGLIME